MNTANPSQAAPLAPAASPFSATLPGRAALAIAASAFVAACAHLSVPLPFTPVPLTFSDLAVLLVGLTLGPTTAFAALVLYLTEGALGLPVFSSGAFPDVLHRFAVTGGYLFSYPFAAALAGTLSRRFKQLSLAEFPATLAAAASASALIMFAGTLWLGVSLHLTALLAFTKGAAPFLPGQAIKVLAAAGLVTSVHRLRKQ